MLTDEQKATLETEIKQLEQISREKDGNDEFAKAQFDISSKYSQLGELDNAIKALRQIALEDSKELYNKAQSYLEIYQKIKRTDKQDDDFWIEIAEKFEKLDIENKNIENTILYFKKVKNKNIKDYTYAQLKIALIYFNSEQYQDSILFCEKINEAYPIDNYIVAQYILGVIYQKINNIYKAKYIYENLRAKIREKMIESGSSVIGLDKVLNNLGIVFKYLGNYNESIKVYTECINNYEIGKLNLGILYNEIGEYEYAKKYWEDIKDNENSSYATAQFKLGVFYADDKNFFEQAITAFENIKNDKNKDYYDIAQLYLWCINKQKDKRKKYEDHLLNTINNLDSFILECVKRASKNKFLESNNLYILYLVHRIIEETQIFTQYHWERKLAHYTTTTVSHELLKNNSGFIRLNKIYDMNDPTEGDVLFKYLHNELNQNDEYSNIDYTPFITCFTMNHDSLNQFRLYGKSDGKEATGISLVVNGDFFDNSSSKQLPHMNIKIDKNKTIDITQNEKQNDFGKYKVYRCIYIDPESGYIKLAQRDKITFYREYKEEYGEKKIEDHWDNYQKMIKTKEIKVQNLLKKLKNEINKILRKKSGKCQTN